MESVKGLFVIRFCQKSSTIDQKIALPIQGCMTKLDSTRF